LTSPNRGASNSISSIDQGVPTSQRTAAVVSITLTPIGIVGFALSKQIIYDLDSA